MPPAQLLTNRWLAARTASVEANRTRVGAASDHFSVAATGRRAVKPAICNVYALSGLLRYVETTQAQNRIFFPSCSAAAVLQTTMASFWRENF